MIDQNDSIQPLEKTSTITQSSFFILITVTLIASFLSGYIFTKFQQPTTTQTQKNTKTGEAKQTVGIADKKTFKDQAEGVLQEGGIEGEGNFHLERPGGKTQNAYLTSSTVDLSEYIGKKVRVWGETFTANKAGWLMDVGLVEVLE